MLDYQKITAHVKLVENHYLGNIADDMTLFAAQCEKEFTNQAKPQTITIQSYLNPTFQINPLKLEGLDSLSFKLCAHNVVTLTNAMVNIATNPFLLAENLLDLDAALGKEIHASKIELRDTCFDFIIAGMGHYIPGPPAVGYIPKNKNRILDKLLLNRENSVSINTDGGTPKFIGAIPNQEANDFIAKKKHNFSEDEQVSRLLLHGKYSHRLMLEAFRFAGIHTEYLLTFPQLLELLVTVSYEGLNLWEIILDTTADVSASLPTDKINREAALDPNYFNFSSRFPFVLKSLIVCFGQHLGLSNLQTYLLDSHWKESFRMVGRVTKKNPHLDKNKVYTFCMEALSTVSSAGDIGPILPFTLSAMGARIHPKYESYYEGTGNIVKKASKSKAKDNYNSWDDYILQNLYIDPAVVFSEACDSGSVDTIRTFKKHMEKLNLWLGLHFAIANNHKEAVAVLLDEETFTTEELERWLVQLAESGRNEIIKLFLDKGANINLANNKVRNRFGGDIIRSPLIAATKKGQYDTVLLLLEHGSHFECDRSPFHLNTALTTAIKYEHENIARLLLEKNPSREWILSKNSDEKNALDLLEEKKGSHWDAIRELLNEILKQNQTELHPVTQEFNKTNVNQKYRLHLFTPQINSDSGSGQTADFPAKTFGF